MKALRLVLIAATIGAVLVMGSLDVWAKTPQHHRTDPDGLRVSALGGGSLTPLPTVPRAGLIVSATGGGPLTPMAPPRHPAVTGTTPPLATPRADGRPGPGLVVALVLAGPVLAFVAVRRRRRARTVVA